MAGIFSNYRVFISQFFRRYHTTGAILPSGRPLASALCRYVRQRSGPRQILEVGPGTGAVTSRLVELLAPDDRLTLIELNPDFVRHLQGRLANEARFQAVADRTELVHGRLEDLPGSGCYDRIISGLPLTNFTSTEVQQILDVFRRLLRPDGVLSFFEYIAMRRVKQAISFGAERRRLTEISQVLGSVLHGQEIRCDWVWPNVTPAWVHHVRFGPAGNMDA